MLDDPLQSSHSFNLYGHDISSQRRSNSVLAQIALERNERACFCRAQLALHLSAALLPPSWRNYAAAEATRTVVSNGVMAQG